MSFQYTHKKFTVESERRLAQQSETLQFKSRWVEKTNPICWIIQNSFSCLFLLFKFW